jgi:hypothetical protein
MIPKVEFVYFGAFDRGLSKLVKRGWTKRNEKYARMRIKTLESAWRRLEGKTLKEMAKATGLKWRDKKITCYVINYGLAPTSHPLILALHERDRRARRDLKLIDDLVHELIHVLFVSNNFSRLKIWKRFEKERKGVRAHVYLYALHTHLFLKIFGENRLKRERKWAEGRENTGQIYARAWEIVDRYSHENLLKRLKNAVKRRK